MKRLISYLTLVITGLAIQLPAAEPSPTQPSVSAVELSPEVERDLLRQWLQRLPPATNYLADLADRLAQSAKPLEGVFRRQQGESPGSGTNSVPGAKTTISKPVEVVQPSTFGLLLRATGPVEVLSITNFPAELVSSTNSPVQQP